MLEIGSDNDRLRYILGKIASLFRGNGNNIRKIYNTDKNVTIVFLLSVAIVTSLNLSYNIL